MNKSIILKHLHGMLLKRITPDGKIERHKLFEVIAERVGKINEDEKGYVIDELKSNGIICGCDKFSFTISKF